MLSNATQNYETKRIAILANHRVALRSNAYERVQELLTREKPSSGASRLEQGILSKRKRVEDYTLADAILAYIENGGETKFLGPINEHMGRYRLV